MTKDLTRGTPWKLILQFALPIMAGNLLQQLYNTADTIIVGNFNGQQAQINKQIRTERQKIKLCREIADSAAVMQRDVAAQEKSQQEKEASQIRDHE